MKLSEKDIFTMLVAAFTANPEISVSRFLERFNIDPTAFLSKKTYSDIPQYDTQP